MGGHGRTNVRAIGRAARALLALALLLGAAVVASPATAQDGTGSVRVVHGVSDLGPIDVYLDGRLAVVGAGFPSATVPLQLAAGDHRLAIAPSGGSLDAPLVDSVLTIDPGATADIALVGSAADMPAVLFPVDASNLDADRARLRVVHGSPDAGPLDVSFTGGDAIFPTVEYMSASEYAELPAGVYAIEGWTAGAEAATFALPDLSLSPGDVVDVYVVGQAADASVQPLVVRTLVEVDPLLGYAATLREGSCADPGPVVAAIAIVTEPRGAAVGSGGGGPVRNGFGSSPVSFDDAVGSPHIVAIGESDAEDAPVIACGAIAGALTDDGALAIPLAETNGESTGIAVVAPGVLDPFTVDVSIFLLPDTGAVREPSDAAPAAEASDAAPEDAVVVAAGSATPKAGD